jgi:hypothetical protein
MLCILETLAMCNFEAYAPTSYQGLPLELDHEGLLVWAAEIDRKWE